MERQTAVLVGVITDKSSTDASLKELEALADTAGADTVAVLVQNRPNIDPATFIGPGKLEELAELCRAQEVDMAIFDEELSGSQVRNIEQAIGVTVIDRSRLILDIFAQRATSREGQCQVELAQLQYLLPRLSGIGADLSRQGGGIGTRGPGETKLESDRRHIHKRISHLKSDLREIEQHRRRTRQKRQKERIPQIALVGYTNAGKSTLLNLLTDAGTVAENKLFATLDPLVRRMKLADELDVVITDTVGFIRKLPHHLVEAFRSTLEESIYADLIVQVVDCSDDEYLTHMQVTETLLKSLGITNKPILTVFNKADIAEHPPADGFAISAKTGDGVEALVQEMKRLLTPKQREITVLIPYTDGHAVSYAHQACRVLEEQHTAEGTQLRVVADAEALTVLLPYTGGQDGI